MPKKTINNKHKSINKKISVGNKPKNNNHANPQRNKLPKARTIFASCISHIWQNKKVFIGITVIYILLSIVFVKGLGAAGDIADFKNSLQDELGQNSGQLTTGLTVFGYVIGNSTGVIDEVASTYQSILLVMTSLAVIWTLRQTYADKYVRVRDSFYRSMYPLVQFLGVLIVIGLQCIPLAIGSWLFSVTVVSGLAVTGLEQLLWSILSMFLGFLTIYMVSSSLFALYVVTLPDMTPMKALKSTRGLVRHRRWEIIRKVLFLPIVLLIIGAVVLLPIIMWLTALTAFVYLILSSMALIVVHSYFYSVYRELL